MLNAHNQAIEQIELKAGAEGMLFTSVFRPTTSVNNVLDSPSAITVIFEKFSEQKVAHFEGKKVGKSFVSFFLPPYSPVRKLFPAPQLKSHPFRSKLQFVHLVYVTRLM